MRPGTIFSLTTRRTAVLAAALGAMTLPACSGSTSGSQASSDTLTATIGAAGGELVGTTGSALEGVDVVIPAGALAADTTITIRRADSGVALPSTAVGCGPQYEIEPAGLALAVPATVTLPVDASAVNAQDRFDDEVKVWVLNGNGQTWGQRVQTDSSAGSVTIQLDTLTAIEPGVNPPADVDVLHFDFAPNPKFAACLARYPGDASRPPVVHADVVRGKLNDGLFIRGKNIAPGLQFDLFTVQNDQLLANGTPDPNFVNFGLAWYQSDLEADDNGRVGVTVRTILLDQIFGFDPAVSLPPTGTFEMGFWFNDPQAAAACGFDPSKPTPFNGEHKAGPLAMISLPDATTGLGPLCTKPDTSVSPARCSP
jgi:hypothetical protein